MRPRARAGPRRGFARWEGPLQSKRTVNLVCAASNFFPQVDTPDPSIKAVPRFGLPRNGDGIPRSNYPFWGILAAFPRPILVVMRGLVATLTVFGLAALLLAGGAAATGNPEIAALQVGLRARG